jgi:hypothetical protein
LPQRNPPTKRIADARTDAITFTVISLLVIMARGRMLQAAA